MKKAFFLDRDGVINFKPAEHDYVKDWSEFRLLPNVAEAIKIIKNNGFVTIVITNQRGVAKGAMTEDTVDNIHQKINSLLKEHGTYIDAFYWCGHDTQENCECRKPAPGLIFQATKKFNIDLNQSWLVGDSETDKLCAASAGIRAKIISSNGSLLNAISEIFKKNE